MMLWRIYYYLRAWGLNLVSVKAFSAILSSFGVLWLAVEIATFFFAATTIPDAIRHAWLVFGIAGLLAAAWLCRPRLMVSHKLNGRDVTIEIAVGNIFSYPGSLVIGSNTTFDTRISRDLISNRSVQGVFTEKYYGDETLLNTEVSSGLEDVPHQDLQGKRVGKTKKYPLGTCIRLSPKQRTAYLVAIADINEHGIALGTFEGLKECLAQLWVFIAQRGTKEPIVMPVLGTGFSRLPQTREEVIRETIKSFVAACSERTFADKLTIVITPHDIAKHRISINELDSFLRHECSYTTFSSNTHRAVGTPI